jgi:Ca2+-binding EF-hand superfamily protein
LGCAAPTGCPFEDDLNHNFWFHVFFVLATGVLSKAMITIPGKPEKFRPRTATFDAPPTERPTARSESIPMTVTPAAVNPAARAEHADPADPTPASDPEPTEPAAKSGSTTGGGGRGRLLEDSLLPKMYKLFTNADDGKIDVADAGLSPDEFKTKITVAELQDTLAPIGGLDLSRVDPKLTDARGEKVDIGRVFECLDVDGNHRVTCKEFLALIRKAAPKIYSRIVEDSCLKKMYDLFTASDSGPIDVADAGLTPGEFRAAISISKLQAALTSVGGLDMARIDPSFTGDSSKLSIDQVFSMLDKNKDERVTMTEFIKLLRKARAKK